VNSELRNTKEIKINFKHEYRAKKLSETSILLLLIQNSTGNPCQRNYARERKGTQTGNEKVKLSLCTKDMITYIYIYIYSKTPPKPQTIITNNKANKVAEYKIKIQKSVPFLYTRRTLFEKVIMKAISFAITVKISRSKLKRENNSTIESIEH
jgi:hypothetical protein